MAQTFDQRIDSRYNRMQRAEDRAMDKLDRQMAACDALIGQLVRDGKTIYSINCKNNAGQYTGKSKEFAYEIDAKNFLIRNGYV